MRLARRRSPRGAGSRRLALWSALAVGGILPSVGCQVEYAGMTLPSGKYMHDDVQYFPAGPEFPWANTQAATQRARMRAMGIEPPAGPGTYAPPVGAGTVPGVQNQGGRFTDTNAGSFGADPASVNPTPAPPAPGIPGGPAVPAGGAPPAGGAAAPGGGNTLPAPPPPGNG
ncbi:hypothetical protein OJF2_09950 [Aquisphaera giovannonii]|uniref:Uncharacterized protein n=1 Tax=Aquisphaera giovannonii TaxID=406548 RepID=A0A5B9VWA3_9BACT|nr:hypothetical protein [Aquisphaera giovannonii]QEH32518.1 hypothetical protein OJF2_09950 [Aquisphaera giovannonii]